MKAIVSTLLCTALALGALSRCAWADEVDDLINLGPVGADTSDVAGLLESVDPPGRTAADAQDLETGAANRAAASYQHTTEWQPTIGAATAGDLADRSQADSENAKSSGPLSLVPEPSAVALAIAALVYFLIFGRRRNVA